MNEWIGWMDNLFVRIVQWWWWRMCFEYVKIYVSRVPIRGERMRAFPCLVARDPRIVLWIFCSENHSFSPFDDRKCDLDSEKCVNKNCIGKGMILFQGDSRILKGGRNLDIYIDFFYWREDSYSSCFECFEIEIFVSNYVVTILLFFLSFLVVNMDSIFFKNPLGQALELEPCLGSRVALSLWFDQEKQNWLITPRRS